MTVQLKVVAVKTKLGWSLVENPHKLFRKSGEVEMRGADVASMSSTLEIIHKYHIISAQISAWEKPF
ncbi:hypothetical protein V8693_32485 [Pseudomonas aeruginosa]|uniref:hypothetical protein n=1 Tax=Pseudomonas aeruginosa TaxID=287 RepID=UPI003218495C